MRADQILSADVLDILFESRNKNYGAYALRKFYGNRLGMALGFTVLLTAGAMLSLKWVNTPALAAATVDVAETEYVKIYEVPSAPAPEPPKVQPPVQKQTVKAPSQKFVSNIQITKQEQTTTPLAKNLDSVAIADVTQAGDAKEKLLVKGPDAGKETVKEGAATPAPVDKLTPMAVAEVMPSFPGGMEGLRKFLQKHLTNPEQMEAGELVSVKIKFVVGYDGTLKSFETVQDGGKLFNDEVLRVLKKMPTWIPGKSRGENVSVYYTIPVKFTGAE